MICPGSLTMRPLPSKDSVLCPYCQSPARIVGGDTIYPHRSDLHSKQFWFCGPCWAWVGVHKGTTKPLGRLANWELRQAKMRAHTAFDPLFKTGRMSRPSAYKWLAGKLGIPRGECHIGMMDVDMCNMVERVCKDHA